MLINYDKKNLQLSTVGTMQIQLKLFTIGHLRDRGKWPLERWPLQRGFPPPFIHVIKTKGNGIIGVNIFPVRVNKNAQKRLG